MLPQGCCPCAGATLDRLVQPAILTILAAEELHGYVLVQRIAGMPTFEGEQPDATGVYRCLKLMERRGLVASRLSSSRGRPDRRLYRITPRGGRCLAAWAQTLRQYRNAIGKLERLAARAAAAPRRASRSRQ